MKALRISLPDGLSIGKGLVAERNHPKYGPGLLIGPGYDEDGVIGVGPSKAGLVPV